VTNDAPSNGNAAIRFTDVVKRFRIGQRAHRSILEEVQKFNKWIRGKGKLVKPLFDALKGISFRIEPGESVGIIGPNGSGKSTMLKLIAGISKASEGVIEVHGRVAALIEVTAGFHPELTGRENVFLNGTILGMSRRQIAERFDRIVEFAGIPEFIDTPIKRYSTGMQARLGFAVAAHVNPDILLIDEVLSVGDFAFQQKCVARMHELRDAGTTVVFVSHNLPSVAGLCRRSILLHEGLIVTDGPSGETISEFHKLNRNVHHRVGSQGGIKAKTGPSPLEGRATLGTVRLTDPDGKEEHTFAHGEPAIVHLPVRFHQVADNPQVMLAVSTEDGLSAFRFTASRAEERTGLFEAGTGIEFRVAMDMNLVKGNYFLSAGLYDPRTSECYGWRERALSFFSLGTPASAGVAELNARMLAGVEVRDDG